MKKLTSKKGSDEIVRYATFAYGHSCKSESKSTDVLKLKPIVKTSCDARIGGCVWTKLGEMHSSNFKPLTQLCTESGQS